VRRAETDPEIILTESFDEPPAASGHKKGATLADHPIA
jgi:hypothetical protein